MCVVCHLLLLLLYVFLVFVSLVNLIVNALLVYNHQTLLGLHFSVSDLGQFSPSGHRAPPFLRGIPAHLWHILAPQLPHNRHHRHGKWSCQLVKLKAHLASVSITSRSKYGALHCFIVPWRSLDPVDAWLVPAIGLDEVVCRATSFLGQSVHPLTSRLNPTHNYNCGDDPARLMKKRFIVRDFFTSREPLCFSPG